MTSEKSSCDPVCVPALAMKWLVPFDIMAGVIVIAILFLYYQTHLCVQN